MGHRVGWQAFAEWALGAAFLSLAALGAASIGVFVLPFALLILVLVARRNRESPEAWGSVAGIGSICLFVGFGNLDYTPCPTMPITIQVVEGMRGSFSCGGPEPMPWLAIGLLLTATGIVMYWTARRESLAAVTKS